MSRILITGGCSFSSIGENERQTWVNDVETKYGFNKYIHTGMGASGNELITYRLLYAIQESLREGYTDISLGVMWSEIERNDVFTNDFSLDMNTDNGNIIFTDSIHTNAIKINNRIKSGFIRPGGFPYKDDFYRNEKQRKWLLDYYKFYNEEYSIMNTLKNIWTIQNICEQNNIKCIMFVMKDIFENIDKYPQIKYLYDLVDWDKFIFYNDKYGLYEYTMANDLEFWNDNFHCSYSSHKHFIDNFDKEIKKLWKI